MPSMGEQKDTWGKRNGAAPILGGGGEKRGKSASETDLAVTTKSSPGLANTKSSGSLKTVPPLRAVDSKQMSALL